MRQLLEQDPGPLIVELIILKIQVRDAIICNSYDFVKVRLKFCSSYVSCFLMMPALLPCKFKLLTRFGRFLHINKKWYLANSCIPMAVNRLFCNASDFRFFMGSLARPAPNIWAYLSPTAKWPALSIKSFLVVLLDPMSPNFRGRSLNWSMFYPGRWPVNYVMEEYMVLFY